MDSQHPSSPPPSATRSLQFVSPTKTVLFTSPEPRSAAPAPSAPQSALRELGSLSRSARSPSVFAQTPASSFSSKIRREASPPDTGSTVSSTSRISRLFSDYDKQKELDGVRFSMRIRELEDERNRALGENETLLVELDKAKQVELRVRKENDDLKEKLLQTRKDLELHKREDEADRRLFGAEVEELKRCCSQAESSRLELEKELNQARQFVDSLERELDEEKKSFASKLEAACKRAVERERSQWDREEAAKRSEFEDELQVMRRKHADSESAQLDLERELQESKRQVERLRRDMEIERAENRQQLLAKEHMFQSEIDSTKAKTSAVESAKRKLEREVAELKAHDQAMAGELQAERTRTQEKIELACRRALEKEREETKLQQQIATREEDQKRKELEDELNDAKTRLAQTQLEMIRLEKSLDDTKKYAERVQSELESDRIHEAQRLENAVKRAVEKEQALKAAAIEQLTAHFTSELDNSEKVKARLQETVVQLTEELDSARKLGEKLRTDASRERDRMQEEVSAKIHEEEVKRRTLAAEIDLVRRQLAQVDQKEKKLANELEEARHHAELLEEELIAERQRALISTEASCKRAVEKDRLDRRAQMEQLQRDEEKKRRSLEKELEQTRMKLFQTETEEMKTQKELEQQVETVEHMRAEVEQEKISFQEQLAGLHRKMENDRKIMAVERQDLDRLIQDLEQRQMQLIREKESLLETQDEQQRECIELQSQLKQAAVREERLLLDMAELRGRATGRLLSSSPLSATSTPLPSLRTDGKAVAVRRPLEPVSSSSKPVLLPGGPARLPQRIPFPAPLNRTITPPTTFMSAPSTRPRAGSVGGTPLARRVAKAKRFIDSDYLS